MFAKVRDRVQVKGGEYCKTVGFAYPGSNLGPAIIRKTSSGSDGDQVKPATSAPAWVGMRTIMGGLLNDYVAKVRVIGSLTSTVARTASTHALTTSASRSTSRPDQPTPPP